MPFDKITKETVETIVIYSTLGGTGGIVHYLHQVKNGEKFVFGLFVINILISSWLGWVVGLQLPVDMLDSTKYAITSMTGFLSYPILSILEQKGISIILNKLGIKNSSLK